MDASYEPGSAAERYGDRDFGSASAGERDRLAAMAEVCDGWTRSVLDRLGVGFGWRCLEVGAGSGTVALWLAGRVAGPARRRGRTGRTPGGWWLPRSTWTLWRVCALPGSGSCGTPWFTTRCPRTSSI